eukprot:gene52133-biopygen10916
MPYTLLLGTFLLCGGNSPTQQECAELLSPPLRRSSERVCGITRRCVESAGRARATETAARGGGVAPLTSRRPSARAHRTGARRTRGIRRGGRDAAEEQRLTPMRRVKRGSAGACVGAARRRVCMVDEWAGDGTLFRGGGDRPAAKGEAHGSPCRGGRAGHHSPLADGEQVQIPHCTAPVRAPPRPSSAAASGVNMCGGGATAYRRFASAARAALGTARAAACHFLKLRPTPPPVWPPTATKGPTPAARPPQPQVAARRPTAGGARRASAAHGDGRPPTAASPASCIGEVCAACRSWASKLQAAVRAANDMVAAPRTKGGRCRNWADVAAAKDRCTERFRNTNDAFVLLNCGSRERQSLHSGAGGVASAAHSLAFFTPLSGGNRKIRRPHRNSTLNPPAPSGKLADALRAAGFLPLPVEEGDLMKASVHSSYCASLAHSLWCIRHRHGVMIHGAVDHCSLPNTSDLPRHSFQLHMVEGPSQGVQWHPKNWLQYGDGRPFPPR